MKHLFILLMLSAFSVEAFAQFPLGSSTKEIKAYFDANIPYTLAQEFKTANGTNALCITKTKVLGDYVFYFDYAGKCFTYIVTYANNELADLVTRFDNKFTRLSANKWSARDITFDVTLVQANPGENYFSIIYKPTANSNLHTPSLASN